MIDTSGPDFMAELPHDIALVVGRALCEDIGDGDKTASLLKADPVEARVICREDAILCGIAWFDEVFRQLGSDIEVDWRCIDGSVIVAGGLLCTLYGPATVLLTGERTALNFLQTLSATATATNQCVRAISHTECKMLDTRKTIPGLRSAQKYAVVCGGGVNHRAGLFDAILIKENHILAVGSIHGAVVMARKRYPGMFVEVEVENMDEFEQAVDAAPDRILLDNFSIERLQAACRVNRGRCQLEASGNITLENIAEVAETGVSHLSIGGITKNIRAIDLSLHIRR